MNTSRRVVLFSTAAIAASSFATVAGASPGSSAGSPQPVEGAIEQLDTFGRAALVVDGRKMVSVIVDLDHESVAAYEGSEAGYAATSPEVTGESLDPASEDAQAYEAHLQQEQGEFDEALQATVDGARVTGNYTWIVGGVTALVPADEVDRVQRMHGVRGVYIDTLEQVQTSSSPAFIGAPAAWDRLGGQDDAGEGVVVGILDSGIWPEHPSLSDPDPSGEAYPAPPASWSTSTTRDSCDFGNTDKNASDAPFVCNNKLIAAYNFTDTYKAVIGLLPSEFDSARDDNGHGTHTATTAAGNGETAATLLDVDRGTVSGIAPRAHVAVYRVCADLGCFGSDSVAAVQQAILDGVDVINFSISGGGNPYSDAVSLAFRDAYAAGVVVNASAGNSGPGAETVAHREPWTVTVGASTSDRHFLSTATLLADNGDSLEVVGASVTAGISTPTPVVIPADTQCTGAMAPGTFSGEIVFCDRGGFARVVKSHNVQQAGGGGMILANLAPQGLATDNHPIPSVHIENTDGNAVRAFLTSHTGVMATFTDGTATTVPGDVMAPFSSRGGPLQTLGISKPDVTAPGVQVLAGHTPMAATAAGGAPGELFQSIQGTSMSAPHSAGVAALVTHAHPDWTAGQIKSAMMLSAIGSSVTKEDGTTPSDPFDRGSGSLRPLRAIDVGITMDESAGDYTALESHLWDANYPSLYVPSLPGALTVQRTVANVVDRSVSWTFTVESPSDLVVSVPSSVRMKPGEEATFPITVDARAVPDGETRHALLTMREKKLGQVLRFPITIVKRDAVNTLVTSCDPTVFSVGATTNCTIEAANNAFEPANVHIESKLPQPLKIVPGSVSGASGTERTLVADVTLAAAQRPLVSAEVVPFSAPAGYLPLRGFGVAPMGGVGDETISNFGVPAFSYAGEIHTTIGMVSNGYAVVGGGTGADVNFINTDFPDPAQPNNVLAPFWTDLNPAVGGEMRIALLTDGTTTWLVLDWEDVRNYSDGGTNDFQIWIETGPVSNESIQFVYGDVTAGDAGFLTVGAENLDGSSGEAVYFDGAGQAPSATTSSDYEVDVTTAPGVPGGVHTVTFTAEGKQKKAWTLDVLMTTDLVPGVIIASESGQVTK